MGRAQVQRFALALAQICGEFEDQIALGQRSLPFQFQQQVGGQRAAAGTRFEDLPA